MGRPRLDLETAGEISTREVRAGKYEARCWYRDINGEYRRPSATADTAPAAKRALKKKLTAMTTAAEARKEFTRETLFGKIAERWFEDLQVEVDNQELEPSSLGIYKSVYKNHVQPRLAKLCLFEVTVTVVDRVVQEVRELCSLSLSKTVRSVISGICGLAVRLGAIDLNPVRSLKKLKRGRGQKKVIRAMTFAEIEEMWTGLRTFGATKLTEATRRGAAARAVVWTDLEELSRAMLATGVRIGEILAVTGEDVSRDENGVVWVWIRAHVVRETGVGILRKPGRKGDRPDVHLEVPTFSNEMWLRRKLAAGATGPLYPSVTGTWLDPSNTTGRLREALDEAGFEWVTSHVWRKTVTAVLDEAGLSTTEIADQLGNTPDVVERHYRAPRVRNTKAAAALERALTGQSSAAG